MRGVRIVTAVVAAALCAMALPAAAGAFQVQRPTTEATQNAYGLWYAPASTCGQVDCHPAITAKETVHGNMVTDIGAEPDKLIPGAAEWDPPSNGGMVVGPEDIYLQVGDRYGFLEYTGFTNRVKLWPDMSVSFSEDGTRTTVPSDDLVLWDVFEYLVAPQHWHQDRKSTRLNSSHRL